MGLSGGFSLTVFSLNEVHGTAKKAARGAGYPWGLAEEAGQAVRWLCSQGVDGCAALARLLERFDGTALKIITPSTKEPLWRAKSNILCPLITGSAILDRAYEFEHHPFKLRSVAEPSLLLAFAASSARKINCCVSVEWPDGTAVSDGVRLSLHGETDKTAAFINLKRGGTLGIQNHLCSRVNPEPVVWGKLISLAQRTYAPATEESRLSGAGSDMFVQE